MNKINIAIDGFSGCGKSSTAKEVAKRLGYKFIDSGAMYRAVTLFMINQKVELTNPEAISRALPLCTIEFQHNPKTGRSETFLNSTNVEQEIRKMYVSEKVSLVAAVKAVRVAMVGQQQEMGKSKGVVMDGRDIASVVFPDAELKIFMKASDEARAKRRKLELEEKGERPTLKEIIENFRDRDHQDSTRAESPLIKVPEAIEIDTSGLDFEDQVNKVLTLALIKIEG